jgi:dTDP-glucose 4,6-dehydratase
MRVKRVLFCSSGGVYGQPPPNTRFIEESFNGMPDPLVPQNAYSVGKRAAEHLCSLYASQHGLEVVVARCFAFVGRDLPLDVHFAIGNFIRDALYRPAITVSGDGTAVRSYLDQRDLAVWLTAMLERGVAGRAYNVGSDQAISMADLAQLVRDALAPEKKVEVLGTSPLDVNRHVYVPSIERARRELGLEVRIPLRQAILDTEAAQMVEGAR